jgi:hypothetical protein
MTAPPFYSKTLDFSLSYIIYSIALVVARPITMLLPLPDVLFYVTLSLCVMPFSQTFTMRPTPC